MSEPLDPRMDPEQYAAALDRLLDGVDGLDGLEAEGAADAQVRADTDAIARGLGLIGAALASEGTSEGAQRATVVPIASWRSKLNPRVLAAAASLVVVVGVGIPLAVSSTGGGDDETSVAGGATQSVQDERAAAPAAPEAAAAGADTLAAETDPGTAAATGGDAQDAAGSAPAAKSAASLEAREEAARQAGMRAFEDDVACARAIFVGTITSLEPMPDRTHFRVSFLVEDWIVPESGPTSVTYEVLGSSVNSPGVDESTVPGQRRLFVVPGSPDERMYAYREKDWAQTRKQIAAVREDRAGQGC